MNDPLPAVTDMLAMADDLYNKFDLQSQMQDGRQTIARSTTGVGLRLSQPEGEKLERRNTVPTLPNDEDDPMRYILKLSRNLRLLKADAGKLLVLLHDISSEVAEEVRSQVASLDKLLLKLEIGGSVAMLTKGMKKDLEDTSRRIYNMMRQVPYLPYRRRYRGGSDSKAGDADNNGKGIESSKQPNLFVDDPILAINNILAITANLLEKFALSPQKQDSQIRVNRSTTAPTGGGLSQPEVEELRRMYTFPIRDHYDSQRYILKLRHNLNLLKADVIRLLNILQDLHRKVTEEVGSQITPLEKLLRKVERGESGAVLTKGMKKELEDINRKIFNLMIQIPLLSDKLRHRKSLHFEANNRDNDGKFIGYVPAIHVNEEGLKRLAVFRQVRDQFKELGSDRLRICLLSFTVFPENQEVNKTMLMYWWIGEGLLHVADNGKPPKNDNRLKKDLAEKDRPENVMKAILDEFTARKLIKPVQNKRKVEPNSYKMSLFVHSPLVLISHEIGLFDMYRKWTKPSMNQSDLNKICLVEGSSSQQDAKATKMEDVEKIETVFNVSERFPDFTFKWFTEDQQKKTLARITKTTYRNLKVLYLGRWERTVKRHIEVENPKLMNCLKYMTKLRLLSFQGISRIESLDDAVSYLGELIILDLRACHHLEKLPKMIDYLKKLVYLDISKCYMLDRMPKKLSWLDNLEVLKGFVVSDAIDGDKVCLLAELSYLKHLRKLSITINKGDLTVERLFLDIEGFKNLEKLKVAWGRIDKHKKHEKENVAKKPEGLPKKLKKLDLQCFPDAELPLWLKPHRLDVLEKLYIKGGTELTGFGVLPDGEPTNCNVKILRLKFLPRLKVEWRDLKERYFPKLEFLEKYQCPRVSLCPSDGIGIWRKERQL